MKIGIFFFSGVDIVVFLYILVFLIGFSVGEIWITFVLGIWGLASCVYML